jgi:hypothetical protein
MDLQALKNSMPDLHSAAVVEKELFKGVIDYSRPLTDYPTVQKIVEFLKQDLPAQHIYTPDLNLHGKVVQDEMEKYLENDALSSSMLKAALKTPLHFEFARSEDKDALEDLRGTPPCFNIGTFLHQALLEPTKFGRAIVEPKYALSSYEGVNIGIDFYEKLINEKEVALVINEVDGVKTVDETAPHLAFEIFAERLISGGYKLDSLNYKKAYLAQLIEAADVDPVTEENHIKIQILKKHVDNYGGGIIKRLLKHSKREVSVYWKDPETGLDLKVRPDAIQFEENIGVNAIISVKSTACEDLGAFYSHCAKLNYDLSEGMYQEVVSEATGRDFNTTITIMLQTVAPYAVAVMVWNAEDIEMGKHKYKSALHNAKEIQEKESHKGYDVFAQEDSFGLIEMFLPGWNQKEQLPANI